MRVEREKRIRVREKALKEEEGARATIRMR